MASVKTMFICTGLFVATVFLSVNHALAVGSNDTIWHYFSNGSVSMYETPWVEGQKTFQIFSRQGEPVYRMENVLQSYSVISDFTFHDNGAVNTIHTSTNPGASLYRYASVIKFNRTNIPMSRVDTQEPARTIDESMGETYLWQAEKGQWIKQEVIRCQAVYRPE